MAGLFGIWIINIMPSGRCYYQREVGACSQKRLFTDDHHFGIAIFHRNDSTYLYKFDFTARHTIVSYFGALCVIGYSTLRNNDMGINRCQH